MQSAQNATNMLGKPKNERRGKKGQKYISDTWRLWNNDCANEKEGDIKKIRKFNDSNYGKLWELLLLNWIFDDEIWGALKENLKAL